VQTVTTNIRHPFAFGTMFFALYQQYNNRLNYTLKASLEQNFIKALKQICFIPLPTALFHDTICVFRAQNNKSNIQYLLVMAQCNWRTRNWTR